MVLYINMNLFDDPDGYLNWYRVHKVTYENERKVIEMLKLENCIDVGSGPSIFHERINGRVVSVDISELVLQSMKGDKVQAEAHFLPFREGAFPCVFISVTLCFLDNLEEFMREVERVTRSYFVGCVVKADSPWGEFYSQLGSRGHKYYSHAHFISGKDFVTLVSKFFRIEKVLSVLRYGPADQETPEFPREDEEGAYMCIKGVKKSQ